jgi:hypothetical protein
MSCSNRITTVILSVLVFLPPQFLHSQTERCTMAQANRALDEAVTLRSWDALYQSYRKFRYCDDGAIAEGYSESVARILADYWSTLARFKALSESNAPFRKFVVSHIDATLNGEDLEKIKENATAHCPKGLKSTCIELAGKADSALKE